MHTIKVKDKTFRLSMPEKEIKEKVAEVAAKIDKDYAGRRPLIIVTLKGAFMYASDLLRALNIECEVDFVRLKSYDGTQSTGKVKQLTSLSTDVAGRDVIIVEDIIETGTTMSSFIPQLLENKATSVALTCFLFKPSCLKADIKVEYPAVVISNDFVVGYGLDYDEYGRELKDIYTITE